MTGTIVKAKNKDEVIAKITVTAIPPTNSVLDPSPVAIGRKANTVVKVAANNGTTS
jgi:hypothetical protein